MRNHPGTLRTLRRSGAATAACLLAVGSVAQDTGAGNAQGGVVIEEVVVTAQKRAENLQDVPVSVTALTSEDLEVSRLRNLNELADLVPNMQELPLKGDGTPVFSLRGLSMGDYSFHQQSPIGMYVDEVYKGNQALNAVPHFDLERVEVLRGPQGTLYGKNTTGGAVNFITRRPEMENAHYVTVGAGSFGLLEAHGAFNAVLSDTFAIRLAGTYGTADGWFENVNPGVDDAYSTDSRAVRLSALWQPRDDVEVLLRAQSGKSNPVNWAAKVLVEQPPVWFGVYDLYNAFGGSLPAPTQGAEAALRYASRTHNGKPGGIGMAEQASTMELTHTSGAPVRIDPAVLAGQGLEPGPEQDGVQSFFKSVFEGDIISSVYESGPLAMQVEDLMFDEFIYVLAGELVLTGADDGVAHTFRTGDHLVLPKGWTGTWEMVGGTYRELIVVEAQTYLRSMQELGLDT